MKILSFMIGFYLGIICMSIFQMSKDSEEWYNVYLYFSYK